MKLYPNGPNEDHRLRFILQVVVHPKVAQAEFPRAEGVLSHTLPVPGLHGRLVGELDLDLVEHDGLMPRGQRGQLLLSVGRELNPVAHRAL